MEVLTAIRRIGEDWKALPSSCIKYCFQLCFSTTKDGAVAATRQRCDVWNKGKRDLNSIGVRFGTIRTESLLSVEVKYQVTEPLIEESWVAFIERSTLRGTATKNGEAVSEKDSINKELKVCAIATFWLEWLSYEEVGYLRPAREFGKEHCAQKTFPIC